MNDTQSEAGRPILLQQCCGPRVSVVGGPSYHFERSLDVDALAPRHGRVGQAVPGAPPTRHVHPLAPQVAERLDDHQDGVVGQRRRVLRKTQRKPDRPGEDTAATGAHPASSDRASPVRRGGEGGERG